MPHGDDIKTEWSSDYSTLLRIDYLIKEMHKAALNVEVPVGEIRGFYHLRVIDRLFVEARPKANKKELDKLKEIKDKINKLINKYKSALYKPTVNNHVNQEYVEAWGQINAHISEYEIQVMLTLDNHNMLMQNKESGITRFARS